MYKGYGVLVVFFDFFLLKFVKFNVWNIVNFEELKD